MFTSNPAALKTADEISTAIVDKIFTTSTTRLNEAQLQSYEHMIKFSLGKVIEANKISSARIGNELVLFHFDKVFADKPFQIESNGIRHNLTVNECLNREGSYISPFYLSISIWVFSRVDPRSVEKRLELIKRLKNLLRMKSKAKRIRVEQFEMSAVQTLGRKRQRKYTMEDRTPMMEDGEFDEEELLKTLTDEDFQALYDDNDPRYRKKLEDAYALAKVAPYEKTDYPYFISHVCFPRHTLIEIPVMLDSSLCHVSDEISGMMNDIYSTSGGFIFKGKRRPFMRTNYCRFSNNMIFAVDGDVENRSAHTTSTLRNSSSTLTCCLQKQNQMKLKKQYLEWKIPYCYDYKVPWHVLLAGCGLFDPQRIQQLVVFELHQYFRKPKLIPMDQIMEIVQYSLAHHSRGSEKIVTQEDAWLFIGKLTEKADELEYAVDLIATPAEDRKVPKVSKGKRKMFTLNAIAEASHPDRAALEAERKQMNDANPIITKVFVRDPNKEWIRIGRQTICKEILPHVGGDMRCDEKFWETKAMHLIRMSVKRLIARAATFTPNPGTFLMIDNRDCVENRRIQLVSAWVMNQLVKGVITSHIKMARLEWISAMHSGNQPEPNISLDHQRPTNLVMTAFGTGIFKSRMMPALIASQMKAGRKTFSAPDAHKKPNSNSSNSSKSARDRTGITQVQNNTNVFSTWSQQVRINGNLQSTGGATSSAREVTDDLGVVDVVETPDNKGCGLIKSHALYSRISVEHMNDGVIVDLILEIFPVITEHEILHNSHLYEGRLIHVSVNERVIGMVTKEVASEISEFLRAKRYTLAGDSFLTVVNPIETSDLKIYTEGGRLVRALFNVKTILEFLSPVSETDLRPLWSTLTWDEMLDGGFIHYLDKAEENHDTLIAMNLNDMIKIFKTVHDEVLLSTMPFTHCEIKGVLILGMCSSQVSFATHNQGPRWVYATAMVKQAMASKYLNDATRIDTLLHQLAYSDKRLCYTIPLNWMRAEDATPCTTIDVAILTYKGKHQEDSTGINVAWRDRGWGRSYQTATYTVNEVKPTNTVMAEFFHTSDPQCTLKRKIQNYDHLDVDGLPFEDCTLTSDDMMVSRVQCIRPSSSSEFKYMDTGVVTLKKNAGRVKRVLLTSNLEGCRKARITTEKLCKLSKGDKLCLTPAHEVLTANGWKFYSELTDSDLIATLTDNGTRLDYVAPLNRYEFDYQGRMYCVQTDQVSLITTPGHKMWVQKHAEAPFYELLSAREIHGRVGEVRYMKSCLRQTNTRPLLLSHCSTHHEMDKYLRTVAKEVNMDYEQNLPSWVWFLNQAQCQLFLDALTSTRECEYIMTQSHLLADDIQRLCLHAGWSADICERGGGRCVKLNKHDEQNRPRVCGYVDESWVRGYHGKVWCVEVPSHIFYVRLNGIPVWTGNSSVHAQKTTVGEEIPEPDIPFSVSGRIVGCIFNTMGIPSRMTVGHLLEPLAGEVSTKIMQRINATPWDLSYKQTLSAYKRSEDIAEMDYEFLRHSGANCTGNIDLSTIDDNENRILEFANVLKHHGFNKWGEEEFISGETGELLGIQGSKGRKAGLIFRGKMSYYILTHRAEDKLHCRSVGARHSFTRQPVEGGARNGGYRLGEMEAHCLIVHGASSLLRERHMLVSDKYTTYLCSYCGNNCDVNLRDQIMYCKRCDSEEGCGQTNISYGFKLLMNMLKSSSFFPRYVCSKVNLDEE